jgi:hypothetical protein
MERRQQGKGVNNGNKQRWQQVTTIATSDDYSNKQQCKGWQQTTIATSNNGNEQQWQQTTMATNNDGNKQQWKGGNDGEAAMMATNNDGNE